MTAHPRNVQDVYPLSPMQQGILFHSENGSDSYIEQMSFGIRGDFDAAAFKQAWHRVVERHAILRTSFAGKELREPIQIVHTQVQLPFEQLDWRELSEQARHDALVHFLAQQREQAFDLAHAPLMRVHLIRTEAQKYEFVWTYHHILLDGWSVPLLLEEVFVLYEHYRGNNAPSLPPEHPYREYIVWLKQRDAAKAEAFWRTTLKGFTSPTELALANPRSESHDRHTSFFVEKTLSTASTVRLQSFARKHGFTLNTLVQGAWALLLSRYSGSRDVLFGATVSGRPADLSGSESMIGLFINTLPVRVTIAPGEQVLAWLKRLQSEQTDARQFEYSPLSDIQRWSEAPRGTPLFDTLVVFENYPAAVSETAGEGLAIEGLRSSDSNPYPLTVVAGPGDELFLKILSDDAHYLRGTVERILDHLATIIESIPLNADALVTELPLLTATERDHILTEWNSTESGIPETLCAHELFEAQARANPDALAIKFQNEELTYGELDHRANQLAHYLRKLGVGPEILVGLCVERSLAMVVGILGILKAGGAYVPLDARYPIDRLKYMIADCAAPVLLTQSHLLDRLPIDGLRIVSLDSEWEQISHESETHCDSGVSPANLAYVIYTSGSTGKPKGTMLQHRGLVNLAAAQSRELGVTSSSRVLQFATFSFDASVWEIFMALPNGATLVLEHHDRLASIDSLHSVLSEERITTVLLPPSVLALLSTEGLDDLQTLIAGGEACSEQLVQRWAPGRRFLNAYGPTEITVCATMALCNASEPGAPAIGRPLSNAKLYVLDDRMQPLPVGVAGELYIGGAGVARGYLQRAELTAERFVPDPFSSVANARLYRSGDLVRWRTDGQLEYVGRMDEQVKLRGYRIELGEIENALKQCGGVEDCAVVVREEAAGEKRLVAYIVGTQPNSSELRTTLKERLPDYMVPSAFVALDRLPVTVNGKVDRRALQSLGELPQAVAAYVAPRNLVEQTIADVWGSVLHIERVGAHDNFFELGGHSLLATQVASRLRSVFGIELPLSRLLEAPTVAELALSVQALRAPSAIDGVPIAITERPARIPLSFAQQRLWFIDQLEPGNAAYNIPAAVRLAGVLDLAALQSSLNEVIRRHESLRTIFESVEGRAVQTILSDVEFAIAITDLTSLPEEERELAAKQCIQQESQAPFDLARWPLLRARLIRLRDDDHIAILTMHHIISDGWSMEVLVREFISLYVSHCNGQPSPLPELPLHYADYACWQRARLAGPHLDQELDYWRNQLAGMPTILELPTDRQRSSQHHPAADVVSFTLPRKVSDTLSSFSRKQGATVFMTLMAAFQALLCRYTGQSDFGVGIVTANRDRAELENLIGFFVNTLVIRATLLRDCTFERLVENVKRTCLDAYAHQELPFEQVVGAIDPDRATDRTPLFQVMFSMQSQQVQAEELPNLKVSPVPVDNGAVRFDLTLTMSPHADGLSGELAFNSALWNRDTIDRMAQHFETLLTNALAEPRKPIASLRLIAPDEQSNVVTDWNATALEVETDTTLDAQFELQARRTPDRVAVRFGGRQLTYKELDCRANALAHHLSRLGLAPEAPVALSFERSLDMIVALLAVWKAGGAYVPLDPAYPSERVEFILNDTGAKLILTHAAVDHFTDSKRTVVTVDAMCDVYDGGDLAIEKLSLPDNAAYIIYTSGSTGRPKGVVVSHRSVINLAAALRDRMYRKFTQPVHASLNAPLSFDASVKQLVLLLDGHTLEIVPEEVRRDGAELLSFVREQRLDVLDTVPAQMKMLVAEGMFDDGGWIPPLLFVGGEALDLATWQRLAQVRSAEIFNMYGPTESTVDTTSCHIQSSPDVVAIGQPIANLQIYVLDDTMQPVPIGISGELYVGGIGVARCYLNRPDLTAERFIPDPFATNGSRLYRTGDKVRWLSNGQIEFLGRFDDQVKVRGYRIELGEIETVLQTHTGVRSATVIVREDTPGDRRLVAYFVSNDAALHAAELRSFASERLPAYMVPSAFVHVEAMPLMPNGKTDRRALPMPDGVRDTGRSFVPPATKNEEILARVWSQLLGVDRVSRNDNFFELGGDSILSIQAVALARKEGLVFKPRQLFECPILHALAQVAVEQDTTAPAVATTISGEVPLTPVQSKFFEHHTAGPQRFNSSMMLEVNESLNPRVLKETVQHIITHHDQLRARFDKSSQGWRQTILELREEIPFSYQDLSNTDPHRTTEVIESAAATLQAEFDLGEGNLLRVAYLDFGAERSGRLLFIFHHLVVDGVSWRTFLEDFEHVYTQLSRGEQPQLSPKTSSYQEWANALVRHAASLTLNGEIGYWRNVLATTPTPIPCDDSAGASNYASMQTLTDYLDEQQTTELLRDMPATLGIQVKDALVTALARTFAHESGSRRLLLQMEGHGREEIIGLDVSRTIGWFTSVFPVAIEVSGKDAVSDMLSVRDQLARVPNHGIGYGVLRYLSTDRRIRDEFSAHPMPDINFNYLGQFDRMNGTGALPARIADEYVGLEQCPEDLSSNKLFVIGVVTGGKLGIRWLFSTNLFHRSTVERLAKDYLDEIRTMLLEAKCSQHASAFAMAQVQAD